MAIRRAGIHWEVYIWSVEIPAIHLHYRYMSKMQDKCHVKVLLWPDFCDSESYRNHDKLHDL
jgi:hypothetical protein